MALVVGYIWLTLFPSSTTLAQDTSKSFPIVVFRDSDSLTVYVPSHDTVSLRGVQFEITDNQGVRSAYPLDVYPPFGGLNFDALQAPICLRLVRQISRSVPPIECQQLPSKQVIIASVNDANVFWFDQNNNQGILLIVAGSIEPNICPPQEARCPMDILSVPGNPQPTVTPIEPIGVPILPPINPREFSAIRSGSAYGVAFSPNSNYVAVGSDDHIARLWDSRSGQLIQTFIGHKDTIYGLAYSPDGNSIATASADGSVRLWNVHTGDNIHVFLGHQGAVFSVAYAPDGQSIISGGLDKTAQIWSIATGQRTKVLRGHINLVSSVAFSQDSRTVLTGSFDRTAKLWDVSSGNVIQTFLGHAAEVIAVTFSPNN